MTLQISPQAFTPPVLPAAAPPEGPLLPENVGEERPASDLPCDRLMEELISKGWFDSRGRFIGDYEWLPKLPPLGDGSIKKLSSLLTEVHEVKAKEGSFTTQVTLLELLQLLPNHPQNYLVGGIVPYILEGEYYLKAIESIGVEGARSLVGTEVIKSCEECPPDKDIRVILRGFTYSRLMEINRSALKLLAGRSIRADGKQNVEPEEVEEKTLHNRNYVLQVGKDLLLTFPFASIDLLYLPPNMRRSLSSRDDMGLRLPTIQHINELSEFKIIPTGENKGSKGRGRGWMAIFSRLTMTLTVKDPEKADHKVWMRLIALFCDGYACTDSKSDMQLLRNNFIIFATSRGKEIQNSYVALADKIINEHYAGDPLKSCFFHLNSSSECYSLTTEKGWKSAACSLSPSPDKLATPVAKLLVELMLEESIPLKVIHALFVAAAPRHLLRPYDGEKALEFAFRPHLESDYLQVRLREGEKLYTLLLPFDYKTSIKILADFIGKCSTPKIDSLLQRFWCAHNSGNSPSSRGKWRHEGRLAAIAAADSAAFNDNTPFGLLMQLEGKIIAFALSCEKRSLLGELYLQLASTLPTLDGAMREEITASLSSLFTEELPNYPLPAAEELRGGSEEAIYTSLYRELLKGERPPYERGIDKFLFADLEGEKRADHSALLSYAAANRPALPYLLQWIECAFKKGSVGEEEIAALHSKNGELYSSLLSRLIASKEEAVKNLGYRLVDRVSAREKAAKGLKRYIPLIIDYCEKLLCAGEEERFLEIKGRHSAQLSLYKPLEEKELHHYLLKGDFTKAFKCLEAMDSPEKGNKGASPLALFIDRIAEIGAGGASCQILQKLILNSKFNPSLIGDGKRLNKIIDAIAPPKGVKEGGLEEAHALAILLLELLYPKKPTEAGKRAAERLSEKLALLLQAFSSLERKPPPLTPSIKSALSTLLSLLDAKKRPFLELFFHLDKCQLFERATASKVEVKPAGARPSELANCEKSIAKALLTTHKAQDHTGRSPAGYPQLYEQLLEREHKGYLPRLIAACTAGIEREMSSEEEKEMIFQLAERYLSSYRSTDREQRQLFRTLSKAIVDLSIERKRGESAVKWAANYRTHALYQEVAREERGALLKEWVKRLREVGLRNAAAKAIEIFLSEKIDLKPLISPLIGDWFSASQGREALFFLEKVLLKRRDLAPRLKGEGEELIHSLFNRPISQEILLAIGSLYEAMGSSDSSLLFSYLKSSREVASLIPRMSIGGNDELIKKINRERAQKIREAKERAVNLFLAVDKKKMIEKSDPLCDAINGEALMLSYELAPGSLNSENFKKTFNIISSPEKRREVCEAVIFSHLLYLRSKKEISASEVRGAFDIVDSREFAALFPKEGGEGREMELAAIAHCIHIKEANSLDLLLNRFSRLSEELSRSPVDRVISWHCLTEKQCDLINTLLDKCFELPSSPLWKSPSFFQAMFRLFSCDKNGLIDLYVWSFVCLQYARNMIDSQCDREMLALSPRHLSIMQSEALLWKAIPPPLRALWPQELIPRSGNTYPLMFSLLAFYWIEKEAFEEAKSLIEDTLITSEVPKERVDEAARTLVKKMLICASYSSDIAEKKKAIEYYWNIRDLLDSNRENFLTLSGLVFVNIADLLKDSGESNSFIEWTVRQIAFLTRDESVKDCSLTDAFAKLIDCEELLAEKLLPPSDGEISPDDPLAGKLIKVKIYPFTNLAIKIAKYYLLEKCDNLQAATHLYNAAYSILTRLLSKESSTNDTMVDYLSTFFFSSLPERMGSLHDLHVANCRALLEDIEEKNFLAENSLLKAKFAIVSLHPTTLSKSIQDEELSTLRKNTIVFTESLVENGRFGTVVNPFSVINFALPLLFLKSPSDQVELFKTISGTLQESPLEIVSDECSLAESDATPRYRYRGLPKLHQAYRELSEFFPSAPYIKFQFCSLFSKIIVKYLDEKNFFTFISIYDDIVAKEDIEHIKRGIIISKEAKKKIDEVRERGSCIEC